MSTCMHGDLEQQRPTYQTVRTPRVRIRAVDHEGGRLAPAAQMIANAIEQPTESDALIPDEGCNQHAINMQSTWQSACHQRTQSLHGCGHRIIKGHQHAIIKVHQHAISAPKAFMDVATEPHARLEEARREHIAKEAAACAVAVVALIEHASRRNLMKEAIMMKEAITMKEVILMKEAITIIIKGRFDSRRWLHASQS